MHKAANDSIWARLIQLRTLLILLLMHLHASIVSSSSFIELGCTEKKGIGGSTLDCRSIDLEKRFSCFEITKPSFRPSALAPNIGIVVCNFESDGSRPHVLKHGGVLPFYSTYVTVDAKGAFEELQTQEALAKRFAPITTTEAALALSVAVTGLQLNYDSAVPEGYVKMTEAVTPSFAKKDSEGYLVRLFGFEEFGCGEHPYYFANYVVTKDGQVTRATVERVYRNPADDGVCID